MSQLPIIDGFAAVWGSRWGDPGRLQVARRGSLKPSRRVRVSVNHAVSLDVVQPPVFSEDHIGLRVRVQLADSPIARCVVDCMRRGKFCAMSYTRSGHPVTRTLWTDDGQITEVLTARVIEVCLTEWPRQRQSVARLTSTPTWPSDPRAFEKLITILRQRQGQAA